MRRTCRNESGCSSRSEVRTGVQSTDTSAAHQYQIQMSPVGLHNGRENHKFLSTEGAMYAVPNKALGLEFDASAAGLGTRSRRYAMLVDDGVATTPKE